MASQSLYRKWRSQTFDEMVGQGHIITTLKNAFTSHTLVHAYLFTGPRGTGKTTTARLLAKIVNCTNPRNGEPCNECQQCREITAGSSFNVIEIDAASNRGIDNIRELREKVMVPPSTGKYKIYILDEAHMLTTEASNALLKTLEEPPDYAFFILATTDVHKMLPTILSRCQQQHFKRISTRQIIEHVLFVAKEEEVELERSAAALIARTAAGGMRDALSLLDQAIAYAGSSVSLAQVQAMLGVADPRAVSQLIAHIASLDSAALLYLIHELSEAGADLRQVNAQVVEYWRALLLAKAGADVATILDLTEDEVGEVQQLTPAFALEELTECARAFAQNELVQKNQGTPQLGLELAALECIESHRRAQSEQPAVQYTSPSPVLPQARPQPPAASIPSHQVAEPSSPPVRQSVPPVSAQPVLDAPLAGAPATQEASLPPANRAALTLQQVVAAWENIKKRTKQRSGLLAAYLQHCQVVNVEGSQDGTVVLIRAANQRHFDNIKDRPKDIEWAISTEFNQPCKVRLVPPGQPSARASGPQSISYSLGTMASQPSAYRERVPVEPPDKSVPEPPPSLFTAETKTAGISVTYELPPPLARQQEVRENKREALSKEELGQKVRQNPVVQELVKTFKATIADIQVK